MRLSKLYTNQPVFFDPIKFNDGLNVIYAEVRLPGHSDEDTHNLGKSTVRDLINFCLLKQVDKNDKEYYLISNPLFENFIFFLEIKLLDNTFITIQRATQNNTKISFKKHIEKHQDFSKLNKNDWDHYELAFGKSKELLDSLLDLSIIAPYSFRRILGYLIRTQDDYKDIFDITNFRGKHADWKPVLAKVLGLDNNLIKAGYECEDNLKKIQEKKASIITNNEYESNDSGEIEGLIALKRNDLKVKQAELDGLDFSSVDQATTDHLVKDIAKQIQQVNNNIYYTKANIARLEESISTAKIKFSINEADKVFKEAGIVFAEQLKKDYQQLLKFHSDIISERRKYLLEEKMELEEYLSKQITQLKELNENRAKNLKSLNSLDILEQYKSLANDIASLKSNIEGLEQQSKARQQAKDLQQEIRDLTKDLEIIRANIEINVDENVASTSSTVFAQIRLFFSEIIEDVLAEKAMLNITPNSEYHLEFTGKLLDGSGNKTSADKGNSYKKLLCIAFDLALLKAYVDEKFPHFVFHDGVFETLDDRKKENLLKVMRDLGELGIQQIITMIDSDTPQAVGKCVDWFNSNEIVVTLHDDGADGRLFKMSSW